MEIVYRRESLEDSYPDSYALLRKHWEEIGHYPDIPLEVDEVKYAQMEAAGMLRIYTARVDGMILIGYAVFIVSNNPHYASSKQASQDVLFVDPDWRLGRVGIRLVKFAEQMLVGEGVQVVMHHVKAKHLALAEILERGGYELVDLIYAKRLDAVDPTARKRMTITTFVDHVMGFFKIGVTR